MRQGCIPAAIGPSGVKTISSRGDAVGRRRGCPQLQEAATLTHTLPMCECCCPSLERDASIVRRPSEREAVGAVGRVWRMQLARRARTRHGVRGYTPPLLHRSTQWVAMRVTSVASVPSNNIPR
jgi:hypothetical protein